jgi:hypothetical protein
MKIKFFSSFCHTNHYKHISEKIYQTHLIKEYGENKEIYITVNDDYTHAIITNTAMPELKIPKERVIGLALEPPYFLNITQTFVEYARRHIGRYYIGQLYEGLSAPFIEDYSYMPHLEPIYDSPPIKTKFMSIICSQKTFAPGHRYRHDLVREILRTNLPIDIYGRGAFFYEKTNDSRICGRFEEYEPYIEYQYTIAIENFRTPQYMSEKLANPLLCGTNVLYLGATNAINKFGEGIIFLTGDIQNDMDIIRKIYGQPPKPIQIGEIKDKMNIIKDAKEIFDSLL